MERKVKFGVFADLHVDIIHDGEKRLEVFLDACRKENVDFVIQLGDFCYPDEDRKCICDPDKRPENIEIALTHKTYADKEKIHGMYMNFEKPAYHVIGNHDCDMCSKKQILDYYGAKYEPYYSFDMGGFHFIVLDGNYMKVDGKYISYDNGIYFNESYRPDRVLPYISDKQLEWLENDLKMTKNPSVLFSHQRLCEGKASVLNHEELTKILKGAPSGVMMSLNGHEHLDTLEKFNGIWYYNVNSMSIMWLGKNYTCHCRYTEDIDEKFPNIKFTAPYTESLFAIITMDENGAAVKGTNGEFAGPSPKELGHPEADKMTPCIRDRYIEFN
ncbi:MAG: metallophosphoesterase [Clostridia bacterium]|nr:metallophosphoesterase [Clostridia bacterium]